MSNVIRLKELVKQLEHLDSISLKGEVYYDIYLDKLLEEYGNPLVHIDLIEEDYEEGPGDRLFSTYNVYVTIV